MPETVLPMGHGEPFARGTCAPLSASGELALDGPAGDVEAIRDIIILVDLPVLAGRIPREDGLDAKAREGIPSGL